MALPKKIPVKQMLKLVDQLSPKEHEEFVREIKLQELRHEIQKGIDSLERGEGIPAEEVLQKLRKRSEQRLKKAQALRK
jgi:hypothetical protein